MAQIAKLLIILYHVMRFVMLNFTGNWRGWTQDARYEP